jgi:hypothetical protein
MLGMDAFKRMSIEAANDFNLIVKKERERTTMFFYKVFFGGCRRHVNDIF